MERRTESVIAVRSVGRALAIIELLGEHQELGLEELHYLTNLPKATVSRMLTTLKSHGWVYRSLSNKRYQLRARYMYGDAQLRERRRLVEVTAQVMEELGERTGLVVDLSFFDGENLTLVESYISSAQQKRYPKNYQCFGDQPSLFHSAMGKACLAQLPDTEVYRLGLINSFEAAECHELCQKTRSMGFGERTLGYWEYPVKLPFLIRAVALPIITKNTLIGSIALSWPEDNSKVYSNLQIHLSRLMEAVVDVEKALS